MITLKNLLKDKLYFLDRKRNIVVVTVYLYDEELDDFINKLDKTLDLRFKESLIEVQHQIS